MSRKPNLPQQRFISGEASRSERSARPVRCFIPQGNLVRGAETVGPSPTPAVVAAKTEVEQTSSMTAWRALTGLGKVGG